MRLSRIWRILQIKEGVIYRGRRPRWITPSEICRILHILRKKILSKFSEQQLVMVNYACGFNQSETEKYFEWIIKINIGHPCYDQLTPVETKYLLTGIMRPKRRLKIWANRSHLFEIYRWLIKCWFWLNHGLITGYLVENRAGLLGSQLKPRIKS